MGFPHGAELFNGGYGIVHDVTLDTDVRDCRNEIMFGDYSDPNVVGVCVVWGVSRGCKAAASRRGFAPPPTIDLAVDGMQ